jgi:hypothetical protein
VLGARTAVDDGKTALDIASSTVDVDPGVELSAPEIVLAARRHVGIASGAVLSSQPASRTNFADLLVSGDNAVVRVAAGSEATIERNGTATGAAEIVVAPGAELASQGSLLLDAAGEISLGGRLLANDAGLWLGAQSMALGNAPIGRAGLVLDDAQLAALDVDDLVLRASSMIDVFGNATLRAGSVRLDAAGIRATSPAQHIELNAERDLELAGRASPAATSAALAGATLDVSSGGPIRLGAGSFALDAFEASMLRAGSAIVASDDGRVASSGDLALAAGRLIGDHGVDYSMRAGGALDVAATVATSTDEAAAGFGVRLDLEGASVTHRGRIEVPSGAVRLTARSGDLLLTDGALIDAAGRTADFGAVSAASAGGVVELRSDAGNIVVTNDSTIDVSAVAGGDAPGGLLELLAPQGAIDIGSARLRGSSGANGGAELSADAAALGDLTTEQGRGGRGFTAAQSISAAPGRCRCRAARRSPLSESTSRPIRAASASTALFKRRLPVVDAWRLPHATMSC